eukprot:gene781-1834_t
MGARAVLNGRPLGEMRDQFLRYAFPVNGSLRVGSNTLTVEFDAAINCEQRWMACSGGWDWA